MPGLLAHDLESACLACHIRTSYSTQRHYLARHSASLPSELHPDYVTRDRGTSPWNNSAVGGSGERARNWMNCPARPESARSLVQLLYERKCE